MPASDASRELSSFKGAASCHCVGLRNGKAAPDSGCNPNGDKFLRRRYEFQPLCRLARAIERLFSPSYETVLHGFTDLGHSIRFVEDTFSGRSIGGNATDMLPERGHNGETRSEFHNDVASLPGGLKVKSGSISLSRFDKIELAKRPDERRQFEVKRTVSSDAKRFCFNRAAICDNLGEARDGQGLTS